MSFEAKKSNTEKKTPVKNPKKKLFQKEGMKVIEKAVDRLKKAKTSFKATGEKVSIVRITKRITKHPKNLNSKQEAEALKLLRGGEACLYHYYAYSGRHVTKLSSKPEKSNAEFISIREVTPIDTSDLEKKGYTREKIVRNIPIKNLVVASTLAEMSDDQVSLMLFNEVIQYLGVSVESKINSKRTTVKRGESEATSALFRRETDIETEKIISDLQITKKDDGSYDVAFVLYKKSKKQKRQRRSGKRTNA